MLKTATTETQAPPQEKFFTKKKVVRWVATSSVHFVVVSAIHTLVPADTKIKKIRRFIGSEIIADMIAEHVREYIDEIFDQAVEDLKDPEPTVVEGEVLSSSVVLFSAEETVTPTRQEHDGHESPQQQQHATEASSGRGATEGTASRPGTGDPPKDPLEPTTL